MRVGFIGLGIMGKPMARNILHAGHTLTIFARHPEMVGAAAAVGCAGNRRGGSTSSRTSTT